MSLTKLLIPVYSQMLGALSGWLDKARTQLPEREAEALLSERLAPDMYPLSSQVRFACLQAQEATFRLRGEPLPQRLEALARDGREAGERPGSMADAQSLIDETRSLLGDLPPDALDAGAELPITLELPNGLIFDMAGDLYVRDWAQPQFHFHLITAYAILRSRDVTLGKADFVPHMFAFLRSGSSPQE